MSFQLPNAEKIEGLLMPLYNEEHVRDFVRWFAQRSGGRTLLNDAAAEMELVEALEDYPRESGINRMAVKIWYIQYGDGWTKALRSGGSVVP